MNSKPFLINCNQNSFKTILKSTLNDKDQENLPTLQLNSSKMLSIESISILINTKRTRLTLKIDMMKLKTMNQDFQLNNENFTKQCENSNQNKPKFLKKRTYRVFKKHLNRKILEAFYLTILSRKELMTIQHMMRLAKKQLKSSGEQKMHIILKRTTRVESPHGARKLYIENSNLELKLGIFLSNLDFFQNE